MTEISPAEVERIAQLAHLSLSDDERARMAGEMTRIVGFVEQLRALDLDGVPPTVSAVPLANVAAEDEPQPGLTREQALANAPVHDGAFFRVPRVLGGDVPE